MNIPETVISSDSNPQYASAISKSRMLNQSQINDEILSIVVIILH